MRLRTLLLPLAALSLSMFASPRARADDANPTAAELARNTLDHDTFGFEGTQIHARLVLTDPAGQTQERAFDGISKKGDGRLIKSVIRFTAPANVAGTAFLMIQHSG